MAGNMSLNLLKRELASALAAHRPCTGAHVFASRPDFRKHPVDGFSAGLVDDSNFYEWDVTIYG
jgi:ubiquitin-conjugating enzyme E2 G1